MQKFSRKGTKRDNGIKAQRKKRKWTNKKTNEQLKTKVAREERKGENGKERKPRKGEKKEKEKESKTKYRIRGRM